MSPSKPVAMESFDSLEIDPEGYMALNGGEAPESLSDLGVWMSLEDYLYKGGCPHCGTELTSHADHRHDGSEYEEVSLEYGLSYCARCRFWQWLWIDYQTVGVGKFRLMEGCPPGPLQKACISKLREFDSDLPEGVSTELARYLRANPDAWHRYDPTRFEKLVADIYRANHRHSEVVHVGKPDDGGVDVVMVDSGGQQWLIQAKRRERPNCAEGVSTVRNLVGTLTIEGALRGVVVSTADRFSLRARQTATRVLDRGLVVELVDKGVLDRMLEPCLPTAPWLEVAARDYPDIGEAIGLGTNDPNQLSLFEEPASASSLKSLYT